MKDINKNVLSIIYFFPPIGGSGVQRALKFVKYMPQYGYYPIIETVKSGHNFAYDSSLLNEIPKEAIVYRSNSGETLWLRNIIENVSSFVKKIKGNNSNSNLGNSDKSDEEGSLSFKDRVFKFIELNYFVPDSKIRWCRHAVADVNKILNERKIDCIFSTSYPYTVHLIALKIKKETNLPWIADFRDPWIGNVLMTKGQSEKRKKREEKMEREVITYADKVIMVTEPICETYRKRYPEFKDKFVTITNGFDSADFEKVKPVKDKDFVICYSGILTDGRSPETLIKAVELLYKKYSNIRGRIKLRFIGFIIDEYKELIKNSSINKYIDIISYMPHSECIKYMKGANMNLIVLPDKEESKKDFTGKIFDYIGSEKPILGIMPKNGVASNLIENKQIGKCFNHGEVEEVSDYIYDNFVKWENGNEKHINSIEKCNEYERKSLTKDLTELFDEILDKNKKL